MSVVPSQHYPEPHFLEEAWDAEIRDLLANKVDDLAKYHVVSMLHEQPEVKGDASFYAAALGFHSIEETRTVLEELAECGILRRGVDRETGAPIYNISPDVDNSRQISKLCHLNPRSQVYRHVLRLLANRSLHRAELRNKNRRHRLECA